MIQVKITIDSRKRGEEFLYVFEHLNEQYDGMFTVEIGWNEIILSFFAKEEWDMEEDHSFFNQMMDTRMITSFTPQVVQVRGSRS